MVPIIVRFMVQSFFQWRGTTRRGSKHLGERCIYCNNKSWIGNTWVEHELKSWILAFFHEQGLPICRLWISMIIRNFCIYFNLFLLANFFEVCLIDWYGWSMPCCFRIQEFIFWFDWWKKGCYVSCTYKCIICCQNDNIFVINNKCTCLFSHNFFPWTGNIFFKYLV